MNLPAEVIQHIFSLLSPREIVRLRQVSFLSSDLVIRTPNQMSRSRSSFGTSLMILPSGERYTSMLVYFARLGHSLGNQLNALSAPLCNRSSYPGPGRHSL